MEQFHSEYESMVTLLTFRDGSSHGSTFNRSDKVTQRNNTITTPWHEISFRFDDYHLLPQL